MVTLISSSPEETLALGEAWGRDAVPGWVLGLTGDLGAGKTLLIQGLARGLGITDRVRSPTFTLVNEYAGGRLALFHLDLYRLETPDQVIAAGLEPYFHQPAGVTAVEWAERWFRDPSPAPPNLWMGRGRGRRVTLEVLGDTRRRICYEDLGA